MSNISIAQCNRTLSNSSLMAIKNSEQYFENKFSPTVSGMTLTERVPRFSGIKIFVFSMKPF